MKIYIAAFYHSRKAQAENSGTAYARAAALADPAYSLESFHYIGDNSKLLDIIRSDKRTIFLDSSAFSMFTQGIKVDLKAYARFVEQNHDIIEVAASLDFIGAGQEQQNYDQLKTLETMLGGKTILPVHHVRDRDEWLKRYLDEGYDYICLGGMVPETPPHLRKWLDHVWDKYLTNPDGTPRVKVHGFGLTTLDLMYRYPWYSVDSTSWVKIGMFGAIYLDIKQPNGSIRDYKIDFSSKSQKLKDINSWHFTSLTKMQQHKVLQRLEELEAERIKFPQQEAEMAEALGFKQGYNVRSLAESYGWRDHFNINYFRRAQGRAVKIFRRPRESLFT